MAMYRHLARSCRDKEIPRHYAIWTMASSALNVIGTRIGTLSESVLLNRISRSYAQHYGDAVREQIVSDVSLGPFLSGK